MPSSDSEIVVDDPTAPDDNSPGVVQTRTVEIVTLVVLFALACLLGWDNWRSGAAWDDTGPQPGYFPFYLSIILGMASLFGIANQIMRQTEGNSAAFVTRAQLGRVAAVFVPTVLFCVATQFLGIYVASFLLIAGFMRAVGKIAWWKSLLTALVFTGIMFVVFDVAFDVIMPKGPIERALGV